MSRISFILLSVVFVWLLQLCLSYVQIKKFNSRVIELRKQGAKTAVGMTGNTYKRRVYAVLVVDARMRITAAEQFSGWTVFARLKATPVLLGQSIDVIQDTPQFGMRPKIWKAFRNSARYITEHDERHDGPQGEVDGGRGGEAKTSERKGGRASSRKRAGQMPTGWRVGKSS